MLSCPLGNAECVNLDATAIVHHTYQLIRSIQSLSALSVTSVIYISTWMMVVIISKKKTSQMWRGIHSALPRRDDLGMFLDTPSYHFLPLSSL